MGKRYNSYVRMKPYKEDSTKGQSLIKPRTYKGDVMVQVWMDSRVLATLSLWLDNEGNYTRFMSEIVRTPLTILCNHLVDNGSVDMVGDTLEAREMLERKYRVNLNPDGKGLKNFQHNNTLTDKLKGVGVKTPEYSEPKSNSNMPTFSNEEFEKAWEESGRLLEEKRKEKRKNNPDTSEIVPQIMSKGLDEEEYNRLMAEPVMESKVVKKSDAPRVKTEEENEQEALELEKSDRLYAEKLKNM